MSAMPVVTVGVSPRERFSKAVESINSILENTTIPYELLIVDCNTPVPIQNEIENITQSHDHTRVIRTNEYLMPSKCKNLIIANTQTPFLCLVENDVLVPSRWIESFIESIETHQADVIVPLIYEIFEDHPDREPRPHFDDDLGKITVRKTENGKKRYIIPRESSRFNDPNSHPSRVDMMEAHCLFFRTKILHQAKQFDGDCSASDEIDISMALYEAGAQTIFDPSCSVTYIQPSLPVQAIDRNYFELRWNPETARMSHEKLVQRWNLAACPQLLGFWHERYHRGCGTLSQWRGQIKKFTGDAPFILVDEEQFRHSGVTSDLQTIPFTELNGQYWGNPENDSAAIKELQKQINAGVTMIVFTWNTFWFFDHYRSFFSFLSDNFRRVVDEDHLIAFELTR